MTAALFRQCMDALCPRGWSANDAAAMLCNLEGQPPKRETVRDWLTRDAVPDWVWPQLDRQMAMSIGLLTEVRKRVRHQ